MNCAEKLGPAVAAASLAASAANMPSAESSFCDSERRCGVLGDRALPDSVLDAFDRRVLCSVMCCCRAEQQHQVCVQKTLDAADQQLGYSSRYKAEISFNMTTDPPSPFMHRENGKPTTRRSRYWQRRAQNEIAEYQSGKGMVRIPDVVVVKDPAEPPTRANIHSVVEMKFGTDDYSEGVEEAYQEISGGKLITMTDRGCNCDEPEGEPILLAVPQTEDETESAQEPGNATNWGEVAAVVGLGIATVALALLPLDGPVGEAAAGAAFLLRMNRLLNGPPATKIR